ncbi:MAG: TRAP transporter substrate-binding protein DctP [Rhodospirillaceae bacterium]
MMFAASDALAMNAAVMETFVTDCDECLDDYRQSGTVLLGTYAVDGWSMLCRDRVANLEDLKGKRVRTSGALGRLAQAFGATPVSMSSGDMIEAIARGQIDCILGSVAWLQAYPIEDSIKSIYELRKGVVTVNLFVMNQNSWKGLSVDKQKLMLEKMPRAIARTMIEGYTGDDAKAVALAKKMNIDLVKPEPAAEELFRKFQEDELKTVVEKAKARGAKDGQKIVDSVLKNYAKWEKALSAFDRNDLEKLSENYAKLLWDNVYSKIDPAKL